MCLIFAQKQLPFTEPLDHLEAFAGDQSVTLGEIEDMPIGFGIFIVYRRNVGDRGFMSEL